MLLSRLNNKFFERIYKTYNSKRYLFSDPILFPSRFSKKEDVEIASIISSSLSYGNVKQIINTLERIFSIISSPLEYLKQSSKEKIMRDFKNIKHRFTTNKEISSFLIKLKEIYTNYEDMESAFLKFYIKNKTMDLSYTNFIIAIFGNNFKTLLPDPRKKSPMKRFNMFLRWMVREDDIDFGLWKKVLKSDLIYPLDTHIHRFAIINGITNRKNRSIKTTIEITDFFKKINPEDPVKYDFAISRLGILENLK